MSCGRNYLFLLQERWTVSQKDQTAWVAQEAATLTSNMKPREQIRVWWCLVHHVFWITKGLAGCVLREVDWVQFLHFICVTPSAFQSLQWSWFISRSYQQVPTWITWGLKLEGNSLRLRSKLDMRKGCHGCLRCRAQWVCHLCASDCGHPLQPSGSPYWKAGLTLKVLGADVAELSPTMEKFLLKSEIPQYMPQRGEREMSGKSRQKLSLSAGRAHEVITKAV